MVGRWLSRRDVMSGRWFVGVGRGVAAMGVLGLTLLSVRQVGRSRCGDAVAVGTGGESGGVDCA